MQNYNASFEFIKGEKYFNYSGQHLKPENKIRELDRKKILVLGNDSRKYYGNYLATPYLSWIMLENQVNNMDNYDNIIRVFDNFMRDLPEIIIDDHSVMPELLSRMPEISKLYQNNGKQMYQLNAKNQ